MAVMNVNPTRMELTNLKKKLTTARRGHKLLKDKRDELMRQFMLLVRDTRQQRRRVEEKLAQAGAHMSVARAVMGDEALLSALSMPKQTLLLDVAERDVMSVKIPAFKTQFATADPSDIYPYGFTATSVELDGAVKALSDVLPELMELAEREKACALLAAEIEKTRRRVNALEYTMIPRYEETIRYITMKLDESERSATTRLMKVKDMMLEKAHGYDDPLNPNDDGPMFPMEEAMHA